MTDEDEFAARSQLKWAREGDAWILFNRRRRMGRVVPDKDCPGMWRSVNHASFGSIVKAPFRSGRT